MNFSIKNALPMVRYVSVVPQLLLLFFTSCAREDMSWLIDTPINVTATTEKAETRAGATIQTASFDNGAKINAYYNITGGDIIAKETIVLTAATADANGKNRLTPDDVQPYYPQEGTVDIMALYPTEKDKAVKGITSFSVEANQEREADYKLSDLMWAGVIGQSKTTNDVNLEFKHLMAKLSVTITGAEGVLVKNISLQNLCRTVGITALSAAGYSLDAVSGTDDEIQVASNSGTDYNNTVSGSVLFPGQTINGNFIKVETNYGDAYFSVKGKTFEAGHEYTANLTVARQDIGFVTSITDWADNGGSIAVPPGSSAGLKIAVIPDQPYNGSAKTPELTITYSPNKELKDQLNDSENTQGVYTLVLDEDYKAEYFNNTNQGTAVVIITGLKSQPRVDRGHEALANVISGINSMTSFKITAAEGNLTYTNIVDGEEVEVNELEVEYDYNVTLKEIEEDFKFDAHGGDGTITYESTHPEVADVTNSGVVTIRGAGSTRITATMAADGNYSADDAYFDLTVNPRSLKNHYKAENKGDITVTMSTTDFTYNGSEHKPAVVVKDKGRTLQEGKHYTTSYTSNTNAGTAHIIIRGMDNYSSADADIIDIPFTIDPATPNIQITQTDVILPKGQSLTRRATTNFGTVTYTASQTGKVSISANGVVSALTTSDTNQDPVKLTITASVAGDTNGNWKAVSKDYSLTVVESNWRYVYGTAYKGETNIITWTCPADGVWELEAMGAKGANANSFNGGRGADVAGQVFIKKDQKIYIYLGQGGGAFNGGGSGTTYGGGATDFALMKTSTWNDANHLYSRILVAGGGGGALYNSSPLLVGIGGSGGGEGDGSRGDYVGETGPAGGLPGQGGTLSAGGAVTANDGNGHAGTGGNAGTFGTGGNYSGSMAAGGGGGGWFGGASGQMCSGATTGSGGGGSSFIYNATNLSKAAAGNFTYDLRMPTDATSNFFVKTEAEANADANKVWLEITPTILITGGSADTNGQARITYKSAE